MANRFNLLVDPRFEPLKDALHARVQAAARAIDASAFAQVLDAAMRDTVHRGFHDAGADEGSIWIADAIGERLTIAYNTGPSAAQLVGHDQLLAGGVDAQGHQRRPGIVSGVWAYEQPFCENKVYQNAKHDPTLDRTLGLITSSMIVVPFHFAKEKRGVISCVKIKRPDRPDPPDFPMESLWVIQRTGELLSRLIDHWLVGVTSGWIGE